MHSYWIKDIPEDKRDERIAQVKGYSTAFLELKEVLTKHLKKKDNVRDYDVPGWEYRQIAATEYNQAIVDIIKLLEIK